METTAVIEVKPYLCKTVAIQRLANYNLKIPLYISLEFFEDMVHADHLDTETWAEDDTDYKALDGIRLELECLYKFLKETPNDQLGDKFLSWKKLLINAIEGKDEF